MLKIEHLEAKYPGSSPLVLQGISFQVKKGELIGLIGPNGSGKSTLLRVMAKTLAPLRGKIWLDGLDLQTISRQGLAQKMAVVTPNLEGLGGEYRVEDFVLLGRSPYLKRRQFWESKHDYIVAEQAMTLTGIIDYRRRRLRQLSSGELQRACLAKALTQQPDLLLLDEATAHLDINYQMQMLDLVQSLSQERGLTVVAALHDLNLAAAYCQKIILMHQGAIWAMGAPHQVITSDNIKRVYQAKVSCRLDPITLKPSVLFPSKIIDPKQSSQRKIHVVCGGGSGSEIIRRLVQEGFQVSAGVLNVGDSDEITARYLGVPTVTERPFSPISEKTYQENLEFLAKADFILLAPLMIGHGNLNNLKAIEQVQGFGKQVILLKHDLNSPGQNTHDQLEFDFTENQQGQSLYRIIRERGGELIEDLPELFSYLAKKL